MRATIQAVMEAVETLSVPWSLAGIREGLAAFERFARVRALPADPAWRMQLALDEILSNIVRHAAQHGQPAIDLTFSMAGDDVAVEIVDAADAFNPLLAPPPDTTTPLAERQDGGLGLVLVRRLMDETLYERRGQRNHVVMRCRAHADR